MDKSDFLIFYLPLLTIHFYDSAFSTDDNIKVFEQKLPLKEMLDFYVLRTVKNKLPDTRPIEDREHDLGSKLITLGEARKDPKKWDLDLSHRKIPENIHPVPVATDLNSDRTIILDSNHLLANLQEDTLVYIARIVGPNLGRLGPDFIILSRQ
jgi:hypothetical protein